MKPWLIALPLIFGLEACFKDETISGVTTADEVWVLQSLRDQPVTARITLTFPEEGRLAGEAPCNRYFADQTLPLPWFKAGPIGATKRACPELALEGAYFEALGAATLIERQGDVLLLSDDVGVVLSFEAERQ